MPIKGNVLKNHSYDHVLSSTKNSVISGLRPDNPIKANVLKNHSYEYTLNDTPFGEAVYNTVDSVDSAIDSVESVLGEGSSNTFWGSLGGLVNRLVNTGWDDWTGNTANRENIAFQKEYNDTVFQRADTQYQRTVADLRASGLSAQLAAGSPSTVAGTTAAPQRSVGNESVAMERLVGLINSIKSTNASTKLAEAQAANVGADAALKKKELETYDQRVGVDLALKMAESRYTDALTNLKMLEGANYTAKVQADIKKAFSEVNKNDKLIELYDEQINLVSAQEGKTQAERKEINQRIENLKQQEKNLKKEFDNIVLQGTKLKFESKVAEQQAATAAWNLAKSQEWNLRTTDTQTKLNIFGLGSSNLESLIGGERLDYSPVTGQPRNYGQ